MTWRVWVTIIAIGILAIMVAIFAPSYFNKPEPAITPTPVPALTPTVQPQPTPPTNTKPDNAEIAFMTEVLKTVRELISEDKPVVECTQPQSSQEPNQVTPVIINNIVQQPQEITCQPICPSPQPIRWPRYSTGWFQGSVREIGRAQIWYMGSFEDNRINFIGCPGGFALTKFSVTYEGEIELSSTGTWRFMADTDDNVCITVNGRTLKNYGTIYLDQGPVQVKVKYTHTGGGTPRLSLEWQRAS